MTCHMMKAVICIQWKLFNLNPGFLFRKKETNYSNLVTITEQHLVIIFLLKYQAVLASIVCSVRFPSRLIKQL